MAHETRQSVRAMVHTWCICTQGFPKNYAVRASRGHTSPLAPACHGAPSRQMFQYSNSGLLLARYSACSCLPLWTMWRHLFRCLNTLLGKCAPSVCARCSPLHALTMSHASVVSKLGKSLIIMDGPSLTFFFKKNDHLNRNKSMSFRRNNLGCHFLLGSPSIAYHDTCFK